MQRYIRHRVCVCESERVSKNVYETTSMTNSQLLLPPSTFYHPPSILQSQCLKSRPLATDRQPDTRLSVIEEIDLRSAESLCQYHKHHILKLRGFDRL